MMISAILLAAGNSSRMGEENKLLLRVDGETLFEKSTKALSDSKVNEIIVVLGHDYKEMKKLCASNTIQLAINGNHLEGQTSSIQAGLTLVNPSSDAVIICLADMPSLTTEHIDGLIDHYDYESIFRPFNDGCPGHPIIFPKSMFNDIFNCEEKDGCHSVIEKHAGRLRKWNSTEDAYYLDIDTQEEYRKFIK